ncbi:MAG: hypothetical protein H8E53_06940 [Planctomycetes bacterium]|nr:hypothetical protein [Planctomycetota bacterium]
MADDVLQRKIRVLFKAKASTSRMARDLSEDGYSPEEIENAIEEFGQVRKRELKTKRSRARIVYAVMFIVGLMLSIYYLFYFSRTHYIAGGLPFGLMVLGAIGFFLVVKPQSPHRS